jgi:flagellar protein FlgJ
MTLTSIGSLTAGQQTPDAAVPTEQQKKAARDFEAIFVRQLLSSLEKSSGLSGGKSAGGEVFRSMMVSAMADTATEGGGIGLSELILKAMMPPTAQAKPDLSGQGSAEPLGTPRPATPPGLDLGLDAVTAAGLPSRSARLGSPGRVLTEAHSIRTFGAAASGEDGVTLPIGNTRGRR